MDILKYCSELDDIMSESPKKKRLLKESSVKKPVKNSQKSRRINENYGNDGYMYLTKHGLGPGTLPKDVHLLKSKDLPHYMTAIWLDRFLTTDELKKFDIYPETEIRKVMDFYDISEKDLLDEAYVNPETGKDINNVYGMTNIEIEVEDENRIVVYADTKRFGKHEIMAECNCFRDAFNYVKRELGCDKLDYTTMMAVGAYTDRNGETFPTDMWNVRPAEGSMEESLTEDEEVEYVKKYGREMVPDGTHRISYYEFEQPKHPKDWHLGQRNRREISADEYNELAFGVKKQKNEALKEKPLKELTRKEMYAKAFDLISKSIEKTGGINFWDVSEIMNKVNKWNDAHPDEREIEIYEGDDYVQIDDEPIYVNQLVDESCKTKKNRKKSLKEKLVDAPQEVVDRLLDILEKYGFVLDPEIKHENPIRSRLFGNVHIQVYYPEAYVDPNDELEIEDTLSTLISRNMIDEIDKLDEETNCPITWNFGVDNKGRITGGLDIMKQYVNESVNRRKKRPLKEDNKRDRLMTLDRNIEDSDHILSKVDKETKKEFLEYVNGWNHTWADKIDDWFFAHHPEYNYDIGIEDLEEKELDDIISSLKLESELKSYIRGEANHYTWFGESIHKPNKKSLKEEGNKYLDKITVELDDDFGTYAYEVGGNILEDKYDFYQGIVILEDDAAYKRLKKLGIKPGDKFIIGIRESTPEEEEDYGSDVMVDILSKLNESLIESTENEFITKQDVDAAIWLIKHGRHASEGHIKKAQELIKKYKEQEMKRFPNKSLKESFYGASWDDIMQRMSNGSFSWDTVVNMMDDEIREQVHDELSPCTEEEFYNRYCELHEKKYGAPFIIN